MEFAFFLLCICRIILSKHFLFVCSFRCVAATFVVVAAAATSASVRFQFFFIFIQSLLLFVHIYLFLSRVHLLEHILLYSLLLLLVFLVVFFLCFFLVKVPEWRRWRFLFVLRWFFPGDGNPKSCKK